MNESTSKLDVIMDSGVSEHFVNCTFHLRNVKIISDINMELANER